MGVLTDWRLRTSRFFHRSSRSCTSLVRKFAIAPVEKAGRLFHPLSLSFRFPQEIAAQPLRPKSPHKLLVKRPPPLYPPKIAEQHGNSSVELFRTRAESPPASWSDVWLRFSKLKLFRVPSTRRLGACSVPITSEPASRSHKTSAGEWQERDRTSQPRTEPTNDICVCE